MNSTRALRAFLRRHQRQRAIALFVNRSAAAGLFFTVPAMVSALVFSLFPWVGFIVIWDIAALGICCAIGLCALRTFFLSGPTLAQTARFIESRVSHAHPLLSIGLDLSRQTQAAVSARLKEISIDNAAQSLTQYPRRLAGLYATKTILALFLIFAATILVSFVFPPPLAAYWRLPLIFASSSAGIVTPGDAVVPTASSVTLRWIPKHTSLPSVRLHIIPRDNQPAWSRLLRPDSTGVFSYSLHQLTGSFSYRFFPGATPSPSHTITVVPAPFLRSLHARVTPPVYTRLPVMDVTDGTGFIRVTTGSVVHLTIMSHFPLKTALFIRDSFPPVFLNTDQVTAQGEIRMTSSCRYTFALADTLGQHSDSLPFFGIDVFADNMPSCRITAPGENRALSVDQQESVHIELSDDYGIRQPRLHWLFRADGSMDSLCFSGSFNRPDVRIQHAWDLRTLRLYPGDTLYYWASCGDYCPDHATQRSVSDTFYFRVPGFEEIHAAIARQQENTESILKNSAATTAAIEKRLEQLSQSSRDPGKALSWEEQKILDDIRTQARAQADSLALAVANLNNAVRAQQENGALADDIAQKLNDIQKALEDMVQQFGNSTLFSPAQPPEKPTATDMRRAIEDLQEMLPDMRRHLDNTLAALEALRRDLRISDLAQRAQQLSDAQNALAADTASPHLLPRQEALLAATDSLARDVSALGESAPHGQKNPPSSLGPINKHRASMQNTLNDRNMPTAGSQAIMGSLLQDLGEELMAMHSSAAAQRATATRDSLLAMAAEALDISAWQHIQDASTDDAAAIESRKALRQSLQRLSSRLDNGSMLPPQQLNQLQKLARDAVAATTATTKAASDNPTRQAGPQNTVPALAAINTLAASLLSAAAAMESQCRTGSGSPGGMMQGLRKISGTQAAINAATADLLRRMMGMGNEEPGENTSPDPRSAAHSEELAAAQQELADKLNDLAQKYGNQAGGSLQKKVAALEQEARRLAMELRHPSQDVPARQERFLVRLLQTSIALQRQDEGKEKRTSTSSTRIYGDAASGAPAPGYDAIDSFYRLRTKALSSAFPESYRTRINAYFDSLGVEFLKNSK